MNDNMKTIRHSVFETNSSSTHSVSIDTSITSLLASLPLDYQGRLVLDGGQFGWEIQQYNDALTKANYCAVAAKSDYPFFKGDRLVPMLVEVLKAQTGAKEVVFNFGDGEQYDNYAYIDHQSIESVSGGAAGSAFRDNETLRLFIFSPRSVLTTDNDNH